jgi:hypothetical protein
MTTLQFLHWLSQQDASTKAFFGFLQALAGSHETAEAVTQSTHSTPATQYPIVYVGTPIQAFWVALYDTVVQHVATAFVWLDQAS